tara:strand:- start:1767 stop:2498 length:732 start_codon:yes stop_codon:yes gene_type:complete
MDISIYIFASLGVFFFGIAKGGFAGPISMLSVPLMSFVMSPIQAAGILLPLLVLMDILAVYIFWKKWRNNILKIIIPASIVGIAIGSLTFKYTSENQIRLIVGTITILFVIISLIQKNNLILKPTNLKGYFWAGSSGYTSFLIHAGAPPMNFYLLPLKLDKLTYIGTATFAYFIINIVKIFPYYYLGLLGPNNLKISITLIPLAIISVIIGFYLQNKISEKIFYNIIYILLFISGLKLIYDGI